MRVLAAAVLLWLLLGNSALAQVNVIGAVTPGHCASFFSTSQIQDSGSNCGGGGGGITGPGVSTTGDLAVWNNATGTALADTGLSFPGGFSFAGTLTGATAITFPTSGTLATTANANVASVTGTAGQITVTPTTGAVVVGLPATITASETFSGTVNHTGPFQIGGTAVALPISLANGGTNNAALTASAGGIVWSDATKLNVLAGTVTAGQCLLSGSSATPSWATCPGGGGTPGGANTNVQFNNSSAFGGDAGFTYAGNGQVTHALGTIATNLKALTITGTWNAAGVTFDAPLFMNITNTASAAGSTLLDVQVGGTSLLILQPNTNAIMSLADGATASAFRVYNTVDTLANPVNFERGVFDFTTTANTLSIGTQFGGTGSARRPEFISSTNSFAWKDSAGNFRMYLNTNLLDLINGTMIGFEAAGGTAGVGDAGLQRVAAKVVSFSDGGTNANGWPQWGGQARVTADFSVTSSVALVNVTGLSVNVAAGRTYSFATELYVTDAAAGGVQAAIAGTATATAIQYVGFAIADNAIKAKTNATALATAVASTVTTETAGIIVRITGTITVNAAGTLTVQMAQNTSNGTATIAKRGSWFIVNDMP